MSTAIGLSFVVMALLAVYGLESWFFPSSTLQSIALIPALAFGIGAAWRVWCNPSFPHPRHRSIAVGGFIVITFITWTAFALGLPAIVATSVQANSKDIAVVGAKGTPGRRRLWDCDFRVALVGFETPLKDSLCVAGPMWADVTVGDRVEILMRSNLFGTHIYGIKKAES